MNQQQPVRDARTLGTPRMLILGLQHLFAMFGSTILVPILLQGAGLPMSVQTTLFMAGAATLFCHLVSKWKVPVFLGSSFAFLPGYFTIAGLTTGIYAGMTGAEKLQYACGGVVIAGLLYLVLSAIIKGVGIKKVMKFLPPVVTGPIIVCIGLTLCPSAVDNASLCWPLALIALVVIVACNIWGKGMVKITPILLGVVVAYVFALIFNAAGMTNADGSAILNLKEIADADWIGLPPFMTNFSGSVAKFDLTSILVMAPIALAAMMEHIGDISAISATVGEDFVADPGFHRTLIGDGVGTALSAFFGGPANTTYGENTGVLVLSKVYDPRVVRIAALFAVALGFIPKLAQVFGSMPAAIVGGISFILYGMISAIGVRNIVENKVDLTNPRNLIIVAVILVSALGFRSSGLTFQIGSASVTLTGLAIAAIAGIVLNAVLPGKDYEYGVDAEADENQGYHV